MSGLTMLDDQVCTFEVAGHLFGLPVTEVQEVIRHQEVTRVPLAPAAVEGLVNLRGNVVTVVDARRQFGFPPEPPGEEAVDIVVRSAGGLVSLAVDRIGDVLTVDPAQREPVPATVHGRLRRLVRSVSQLPQGLLLHLDLEAAVEVTPEDG
ncbi:chemotaxis protein CheW [Aciditerrimonas ferrireducens]|jgi:purine-binding chemotaxis protein CheW|uniref:Chemotaxis protein CheW n=1 Tax=Aciditerrimonas ferrireducens TaxID=667306 RepID=A0ABV6C221_9ACTN|nr:chemotaxis protein CheW [Aciditerrimonas ferrireducens]MCK4176683.1 chemotaxis protein CheW [Aciditerrimonas ferrireducens]